MVTPQPGWHNGLYSHLYMYITEDKCYYLVVTGGPGDSPGIKFPETIYVKSAGVQLMMSSDKYLFICMTVGAFPARGRMIVLLKILRLRYRYQR